MTQHLSIVRRIVRRFLRRFSNPRKTLPRRQLWSARENPHLCSLLLKMDSRLSPRRHPFLFAVISTLVVLTAMLLNSTSLFPVVLVSNLLNVSTPYVRNARTGVSYRGTSKSGVEHFQNIFYAEDTSGPNRFAPPIPYTPPPGTVVDATAAGAWCPQGLGGPPLPFTSPITNVSENCLSLRIARSSSIGSSTKLPVLVYLHGGITFTTPSVFVVADAII